MIDPTDKERDDSLYECALHIFSFISVTSHSTDWPCTEEATVRDGAEHVPNRQPTLLK